MRFTLGEDVIVTWLDSGMGQPASFAGKHEARLVLGETHGKVTFFGQDPELHKIVCARGRRCRCTYLELAMCSSPGRDDEKADLAGIWAEAIVAVRRWPGS